MAPRPKQVPWIVDINSRPLVWTLSKTWTSKNPNKDLGPDPNVKSPVEGSSENFV